VSRIRRFFVEAWQELKKVNWPTPEQARTLTVLVLAVSFVVGAFIALFDVIFGAIATAINGV
jgi:preprotein translocase SecE subunit